MNLWRHQPFGYNSRCPESQPGSAGTSSPRPIERCSGTVEGESSHLQNPKLCTVINSNNNSMSIMYYIARSLIPKHDELCATVEAHNPDMICIVETWLCADILDPEIALPGYQVHRIRHGGGILIYVRDCFACSILPSTGSLEITTLCLSWF